ncbi:MAG: hypothetical protein DMG61_01655 [Acidobacteria bacterium]|nr:MAG: hypothetical protein DMG61_01655 [Acidobacteriota bacterium]
MYSIEEICDAMITAGSAAALCRSEQDFLLCALQAAGELLEVSYVVFYPAAGSPFGHIGTLRVNQRAGNDLETPENLPTTFSDYLRRQPRRIIVSGDWDSLRTLLPSFGSEHSPSSITNRAASTALSRRSLNLSHM